MQRDYNSFRFLSAPKTASKRVFLITDEDNPHPGKGSKQLITSARTTLIVCELTFPVKPFGTQLDGRT